MKDQQKKHINPTIFSRLEKTKAKIAEAAAKDAPAEEAPAEVKADDAPAEEAPAEVKADDAPAKKEEKTE